MINQNPENFKHPAPCGEAAGEGRERRLAGLVQQASEQRQIQKARRLGLDFSKGLAAQEQRLFELILRCLGYSHYAESFEALGARFSLNRSLDLLAQGPEALLGTWLGSLGLLSSPDKDIHPAFLPTWQAYNKHFKAPVDDKIKVQGRPANHPIRRLSGLAAHLDALKGESLVKFWLRFFYQAEDLLGHPKPLPRLAEALDACFPQREDEPLARLMVPTSKKLSTKVQRLIGPSRQRVVLINGLMPFFLCWALFSKDKRLEKTLFALFLLLPAEGDNHKTKALEKRLGLQGTSPGPIRKNLSYHQGLIQFHDELCSTYGPACEGCPLPEWLKR